MNPFVYSLWSLAYNDVLSLYLPECHLSLINELKPRTKENRSYLKDTANGKPSIMGILEWEEPEKKLIPRWNSVCMFYLKNRGQSRKAGRTVWPITILTSSIGRGEQDWQKRGGLPFHPEKVCHQFQELPKPKLVIGRIQVAYNDLCFLFLLRQYLEASYGNSDLCQWNHGFHPVVVGL